MVLWFYAHLDKANARQCPSKIVLMCALCIEGASGACSISTVSLIYPQDVVLLSTIQICSDTYLLELIAVLIERVKHVTPIATGPNSRWGWTKMEYCPSDRAPVNAHRLENIPINDFYSLHHSVLGRTNRCPLRFIAHSQ
jgi:hypothetical protein